MLSPTTAFWSLSDAARRATVWSPDVAIFVWSSALRAGVWRLPVDRIARLYVEHDAFRCELETHVWAASEGSKTSPSSLSRTLRETLHGYKAITSRKAGAPLRQFSKTVYAPDDLAEEVSRIEGPQLSLPTPRPSVTNAQQAFWSSLETLRLASRLAPAELSISSAHELRAKGTSWRVGCSVRLRTDPVGKMSKVIAPVRAFIDVRSQAPSAKRAKAIEETGIYRRVHERMASAGFFGEWSYAKDHAKHGAFHWSSWKIDDVLADFKRINRVHRALVGSLK